MDYLSKYKNILNTLTQTNLTLTQNLLTNILYCVRDSTNFRELWKLFIKKMADYIYMLGRINTKVS